MKTRSVYVCSSCGARHLTWHGRCPGCREWNTLAEEVVRQPASRGSAAPTTLSAKPQPLAAAVGQAAAVRPTGLAELDRVLGGGLAPGAAVLVGGEPGIGKSTLLLELAGHVAGNGARALYVTGEESLPQLAARAQRLGVLCDDLIALATGEAEDAAAAIAAESDLALVVIDSIQTMRAAGSEGLPGSPAQVRGAAFRLMEAAREHGACLLIVGHVTKEGNIAGPKILEHMVDTVISLEGERSHAARILRVLKNRFGSTDELLVLTMDEGGLTPVPDATAFFLEARDPSLPGTAVGLAMEGRRVLAVEAQGLVAPSYLPSPRRTALGLDIGRLHTLLAVLEKRLRINLGSKDVHAKIGAGLRLTDPGLDLALAAAVLSSLRDQPLPPGAVFWGEVDLSGQVRPAPGHEVRAKQAARLGYDLAFHHKSTPTLSALQAALFA